ncbi:hypothetical protein SCHPADRAFT_992649 [Schizopora paradoxa]|uniref:DUF6533 domain-containing protein n=1 Tax=Schizopora paradoxa TaxID=27342 RepID=A0A0H2S6V6_9AGAM|nr:hypothetical protein SCHPADRAFT_992649 [Schizopora paradoxa]
MDVNTISFITAVWALHYYLLVAVVILCYDHIITFGQEVQLIWKQKFTFTTLLFILNRYFTELAYVPTVLFLFNSPGGMQVCSSFAHYPGSVGVFSQAVISAFLVMRSYALLRRQLWVLLVTIPLLIVSVGVTAWAIVQVETANIVFGEQMSCVPVKMLSLNPFRASWLVHTLFDTIVFAITVWKTYQWQRQQYQLGIRSRIVELILRDGSLYYVIMAVVNLFNFLPTWFPSNEYFAATSGNKSEIPHALSVTLLSRMILNLRQAAVEDDRGSNADATQVSTQRSESIIYEDRESCELGEDHLSLEGSESTESFPSFIGVNSREQRE